VIIEDYLKDQATYVNTLVSTYLPDVSCEPTILHEAMCYSACDGGKRLRAILAMEAAAIGGSNLEGAEIVAVAVELVHAYSLIHDDLPCMDDDDLRRGKPTNHKVFGEAIALLAGDALLTYTFELLSCLPKKGVSWELTVQVINELAQACGSGGMIAGQTLDLQWEGKTPCIDVLKKIHRCKTGALIRGAVRCGALVGEASNQQLQTLTEYAEHLGLAFQITDDILDEIGDAKVMGKPQGSDEDQGKQTYPAIYGLEESKRLAKVEVDQAKAHATKLPAGERLVQIADFVLGRSF
jgi:geranylgeranyl diphosphate synthase type II